LNKAAHELQASVLLFDSPRSERGALAQVKSCIDNVCLVPEGQGAYAAALASADYFSVTGDSVSMASEMLATGKPVSVFPLPRQISLRWSATQGIAAVLARSGILMPPRDVHGFMAALIAQEKFGVLGQSWGRAGLDQFRPLKTRHRPLQAEDPLENATRYEPVGGPLEAGQDGVKLSLDSNSEHHAAVLRVRRLIGLS
jgi:Mitochondrial fission ELM1